ncbi:hypothetical protein PG987_008908 [Apiospora arundinis]
MRNGEGHSLSTTLAINRECTICYGTKSLEEFPKRPISYSCRHITSICMDCVQSSLQAQLEEKSMHQISCLECPEILTFRDVQAFATPASLRMHAERDMFKTLSNIGHFVWCPLGGCESGQIHSAGARQPVVLCQGCGRQFCFTHQTKWHSSHTCDEWDRYLADDAFRSQTQLEREREDAYDEDIANLDRRINEEKHRFRQSIMSAEDAARDRSELAEARRQEEERAVVERARVEEQRRLARKEESGSWHGSERWRRAHLQFLSVSKPCPRCLRPTQKNKGCHHIHCSQCGCHWDWVQVREYPPGQLWF